MVNCLLCNRDLANQSYCGICKLSSFNGDFHFEALKDVNIFNFICQIRWYNKGQNKTAILILHQDGKKKENIIINKKLPYNIDADMLEKILLLK